MMFCVLPVSSGRRIKPANMSIILWRAAKRWLPKPMKRSWPISTGQLACAAAGNIFVRFDNRLITPPVSEGALPGIIRGALLEMAMIDGLRISEAPIEMARLAAADGLFITNSVNGVVAAAYGSRETAQKKQGLALHDALPEFSSF